MRENALLKARKTAEVVVDELKQTVVVSSVVDEGLQPREVLTVRVKQYARREALSLTERAAQADLLQRIERRSAGNEAQLGKPVPADEAQGVAPRDGEHQRQVHLDAHEVERFAVQAGEDVVDGVAARAALVEQLRHHRHAIQALRVRLDLARLRPRAVESLVLPCAVAHLPRVGGHVEARQVAVAQLAQRERRRKIRRAARHRGLSHRGRGDAQDGGISGSGWAAGGADTHSTCS